MLTQIQRYADDLSSQSPVPYGSTLIYYARAHTPVKIRETLSLLISLSLLQSAAMPPAQNLDTYLASLLDRKRVALVDLAHVDSEAAELLARSLSGYALLRQFYDTRDQTTTATSYLVNKRETAKNLVAIIKSASDCIKGGLFDPEVESVVPVEGLLMLLGEVLPLLGQSSPGGKSQRTFETKQLMVLMAVIEDFEQVSGRIREGGEGLLHASMNCFRGTGMSGSSALKKSTSGLSAGSGSGVLSGSSGWEHLAESSWSLLQSTENVQTQNNKGGKKSGSKAKMVEIPRGWDWRKGLDAVASATDIGSKEVIMLLRTALAREVANAWANGWA